VLVARLSYGGAFDIIGAGMALAVLGSWPRCAG
jgi:hypothetical protein